MAKTYIPQIKGHVHERCSRFSRKTFLNISQTVVAYDELRTSTCESFTVASAS